MADSANTSILIDKISKQLERNEIKLPLLPNIVAKVFEVTSDPNSSARDIAKLVMTDQTLTVKIMDIANSAYFSCGEKISSLHHAVARLGFGTITNLIVTAALDSQFHTRGHYSTLEANLWEHSLLTSFIAKDIAEKVRMDGEEAYLAALIHDIGKTILISMVNDAVKKVVKNARPPHHRVEALLTKFHGYVGFLAAKKWKMSKRVCEAIYLHHRFEFSKENRDLVALISLSNKLANLPANLSDDEAAPDPGPFGQEVMALKMSDEMLPVITEGLPRIRHSVYQMIKQG